jgi:hypothetical protein
MAHVARPAQHRAYEHVTTNDSNDLRIFVLSYNKSSYETSKLHFSKYKWAYPFLLENASENNPLYENVIYDRYDSIIRPHVDNFKYIGFLSYKAGKKIDVPCLNSFIQKKKHCNYDATFFWTGSNMTSNPHPHFQEIWRDTLELKVGAAKNILGCFGNFWCAKREILENYVQCFKTLILPSVLNHPKINTDAVYQNQMTKDDLIKLASFPHHTHVPFVLERVPNAWCTRNNLKVCYSIR